PTHADGPKEKRIVYESVGYLVPIQQVTVSATVAGQVRELNIDEGQLVKKGDVLARLDPAEHEAELGAARARLDLPEAKLDKVKDGGDAREVAIARDVVALGKGQVEIAEARLDATVIRAPINGTILMKRTEVGNLLSPLSLTLPATVCEIADLRQLRVD